MKIKLTFLLLFLGGILTAQELTEPDFISTNKGELKIQPVTHGSLVLEWDGKIIYVDPYGGANLYEGLKAPDYILITDIHGDHLNPATLNEVATSNAKIYVPQAVYDQMPEDLKSQANVVSNGASRKVDGFTITAIPMYNLPESEDAFHTKGRGNGYVLGLGGKKVYISGDTEDIPEMRRLKNIDIAFVCMNLPYTMTVDAAADAVLAFKPKTVYPYHYRGTEGLSDVNKFKSTVNEGNKSIDVKLKNWYPGN
ncbi:MBL fold metallo-hydrolase [Roseivirga pacifica]|uniref:MBL fold metallo-hydrolase n=1 Tax=Roseivirga pacifica TaxID=1267423 RepID=UPI003BAC19C4